MDDSTWLSAIGRSPPIRQCLLYGLVGGAQLLVDWMCFVLLSWLGMEVIAANLLGRVIGAVLGFWLNGRYTFAEAGQRPLLGRVQLFKFSVSWGAMSALSSAAVWCMEGAGGLWLAWLGKPLVDGILAILGFLTSKYWIYR